MIKPAGSILPSLLRDEFGLSMTDAGFHTARFVVLATLTVGVYQPKIL